MEEWVMNELYEELLKMPLWIVSAFGRDGEFYLDAVRETLISHLVRKHIDRYPHLTLPFPSHDNDFRRSIPLTNIIPLFKQAYIKCKAIVWS
jgi:hypothetical protein